MKIIKGIDRIALVLAIIVAILVSVGAVRDLQKPIVNPKYERWKKEYDDRIKYLEQKNPSIKLTPLFQRPLRDAFDDSKDPAFRKRQNVLEADSALKEILSRCPAEFNYLPAWKCYAGGIAASLISFIVVLFGIRLTTRGIKHFSLWIIDGFRDEKKLKK